jgi:hypothetical protein
MSAFVLPGDPFDQLIQGGSVNKPPGVVEIPIQFQVAYSSTPVVLLTPFWEGQNSQVLGGVETLTAVSTTGFTLVSGNAAPNYYVMWLAVGPG